ncbi:MAG: SCO family protein [Acidobacteriia bacterium]|nr:SCO family protein [Terriglobia bacterium]
MRIQSVGITNHSEVENRSWNFRWALLSAAFVLIVIGILSVPKIFLAQTNRLPAQLQGIGIDQRLNEAVPLDLKFRDESGKEVQLGDYFGNKPVLLSLVYYDCPMLCTEVLNGMLHTMRNLTFTIGKEFEVVTVSFDPKDTPAMAEARKKMYAGLYGRPGAEAGWHFLTGSQDSINRLTQSVGFRYAYDPQTGQFNHATAIMVLTPQGRISKYFYGITYLPRDVRLGLVDASNHRIGTPVDAILLFCCQYDPLTGKYGLVISRVIDLACGATVLGLGMFMMIMFRKERQPR